MLRNNFIIVILFFSACEEVVYVDLNYSNDRLVIEGYLNLIKENKEIEQQIILSKTTPYYENATTPANGAKVQIIDYNNNIYKFEEKDNTGRYYPLDTIPLILGANYTLQIQYENQDYIATEKLNQVATIYKIEQDSIPLFGENATQIKAFSMDAEDEENYSYFEFLCEPEDIKEYNVYRDDFSNGSEYYGILLNRNLKKGDSIRLRQYSLNKTAYQYWYLLILQNTQQGGPFQTNPANLNGNIINLTRPENNPVGYFRVSEVSEIIYSVK
tara:strand:- start:207 stop:1019 length:813 start_codon:yes stop_codon:yes gene_type:complete